jgi:hypothetical protein
VETMTMATCGTARACWSVKGVLASQPLRCYMHSLTNHITALQ